MSRLAYWVISAFLCVAGACGGAKLAGRADGIEDLVNKARMNGARKCAPRELALAESHLDFGRTELSDGDYFRARAELDQAIEAAKSAVDKSPPEKCVDKKVVTKPTPRDRDGDTILDPDDDCDDEKEDFDEFQDEDGCPDPDNDKDGLTDKVDKCPNEAEDDDGFDDDDGCPDDDNDGDGLADKADNCPDDAEDADGHQDDDGCPDCDNDGDGVLECPQVVDMCPDKAAKTADGCPVYKKIVITETKIELKQTVYFKTNRSKIRRRSYGLLNEVAQALNDNPKLKVRIEGHTDSRGRKRHNQKLSQRRAEAVRDYLVKRKVATDRMVPKGYGPSQPIASNRTGKGREQNRRVEFVIISK